MSKNARVQKAIDYILQCLGSPYVWWYSGPLREGPPPWSANAPVPAPAEVIERGGFCAAAGNLMLRVLGVPIPNPYNDEEWDGGTVAYYEYYYNVAQWFDVNKSYPDGTLLIAPYQSVSYQGHVSIIYQNYVIEWIGSEGLIWKYDVVTSNQWGMYQLAVLPENWLGSEALPEPGPGTPMTIEHLLSVYTETLTRDDAEIYFPQMLNAFKEFDISNRSRIAAFLGQAVGEVGEFQYWSELGEGGGAFGEFWGRGPMQLTWLDGYQRATEAYNAAHPEDPVDFVANPDLVATPKYGFWCGAWFWRHGNGDLNYFADQGDFVEVMTRCYGAYPPQREDLRWSYYNWAMKYLPEDLTLAGGEPLPKPPKEDIVYADINLVAAPDDEFSRDYADIAETVLRKDGFDVLFFDEEDNIRRVTESAASADFKVAVVGNAARKLAKPSANIIPVYVDDPDDELVDTLRVMRNHALLDLGDEQTVAAFDNLLICLDSRYKEMIEKAKKPGKEPPAPPAPKANWAGFGKDGALRMGGDWSNGYFIWPDPAKNQRPYEVEYIAEYQEDKS